MHFWEDITSFDTLTRSQISKKKEIKKKKWNVQRNQNCNFLRFHFGQFFIK